MKKGIGKSTTLLLKTLCPQFRHIYSLECESCQTTKHHSLFLGSRVNKRPSFLFELVYLNVWGSCSIVSKTSFRYFVTFIDNYFRMTWLYLMKNRFEVFSHFCVEIKIQFNVFVDTLHSDNAKIFFSESF